MLYDVDQGLESANRYYSKKRFKSTRSESFDLWLDVGFLMVIPTETRILNRLNRFRIRRLYVARGS